MSYTSTPLSGPAAEQLKLMFSKHNVEYCEFNPGKCILQKTYNKMAQDILDLDVKEDDVYVVSYPRTGSIWLQETIWLIANNCNIELAKEIPQQIRAPRLERDLYFPRNENDKSCVDIVKEMVAPRYIKTHVPYELLPKQLDEVKPKIVYIARNPKDVCVSFYNFLKQGNAIDASFDAFAELMLQNMVPVAPLLHHYLTFWDKRNQDNVFFLKYEDMRQDYSGTIRMLAEFLQKPITDEQVDAICDYLSFDNMKKNANVFVNTPLNATMEAHNRKGQIGDWKNYMSKTLSDKFDKWIDESLSGTGLFFE